MAVKRVVVVIAVLLLVFGLGSSNHSSAPFSPFKALKVLGTGHVRSWAIEIQTFIFEHTTHFGRGFQSSIIEWHACDLKFIEGAAELVGADVM
jgi:hypothetical protein